MKNASCSRNLVYALHHPSSPSVYVGKSANGLSRPREHGKESNRRKHPHYPVVRWIEKLLRGGHAYEIAILEEVAHPDDLAEAERFYIAYFRFIGVSLLNLTDGGEGSLARRMSPTTRARLRESNKGRRLSDETKAKMSAAAKGRVVSPETRARISAAQQHRPPRSEETKLRQMASQQRRAARESADARRPAGVRINFFQTAEARAKTKNGRNRSEVKQHAKLTAEQVRQIRDEMGKFTQRVLAQRYGVTKNAIKCIRDGRSWAWV